MDKHFIPVNTPLLSGNEEKYLSECVKTGWISSEGPFVKEFESKFSKYVGRDYGIAVANGSAALDVAVKALGIGPGDEVIVPTFTIISPVQSVLTTGAKPVLVDCDPATWNMDVNQIESKINANTKAIIAVHIYGLPVNMDPLMEICKNHNLMLIEDAAEAIGQTYRDAQCGSFGDISTFSFYPNKHITTGEGGMIVTNNDEIEQRCRELRNLSFQIDGPRFVHHDIGWNYRMTNMQAALGLAQLESIDKHINKKKEIGVMYNEGFKDIQGFQLPLNRTECSENIYWVYGLVAQSRELLEKTVDHLRNVGIGTRPFFWCMHEQPVFHKKGLFLNESYPVSEKLARNGFYLPSGLGLTKLDVENVISSLHRITQLDN